MHSCEVSLKDSAIKVLIVDSGLRHQIKDDISRLVASGVQIYYWGADDEYESIRTHIISTYSDKRVSREHRNEVYARDPLLLIFTSGVVTIASMMMMMMMMLHI